MRNDCKRNIYHCSGEIWNLLRLLPFLLIFFLLIIVVSGYIISVEFIGLAYAVTFLTIGLLKPDIFIVILFAVRPLLDQFVRFNFFYIGSKNINIQAVIGIGLIGVFAVYCITRRSNIMKYGAALAALLFLMESFFGILLSTDVIFGISHWLRLVSWIVLIFLVAEIFTTEAQIRKLINACIFAAVVASAIVILNIGSTSETGGYGVGEQFGGFLGGHAAALMLVVLFPFLILRRSQSSGRAQILYTIIALAMVTAIFLTFVRSAWIGLLVQIILLSPKNQKKSFRYLRMMILMLIVILVFTELRNIEQRWSDVEYMWTPGMTRAAGSGRIWIWHEYAKVFLKSPLNTKVFGYGLGTIGQIGVPLGGHNDFIDLIISTGTLGVGLYIFFLLKIKKLINILKEQSNSSMKTDIAQMLRMIFYSYLVIAIVNGNIYNLSSMWYIGGALGIGYSLLYNKVYKENNMTAQH